MESLSGNVSDKKSLHAAAVRMKEFCTKLEEAPKFLFVGDSALYDACAQASDFHWLTRVPETHGAAKDLLTLPEADLEWQDLGNGYKQHKMNHEYRGQTERWMLIFSEACFQREIKTLEKKIQKDEIEQNKKFRQLQKQSFKCEKDADDAAQNFLKMLPFQEGHYEIKSILKKRVQKKRPKETPYQKPIQAKTQVYQILGSLTKSPEKIEFAQKKKGKFILATNQTDLTQLPDEQMLPEYKRQSNTEQGFHFIKDNAFEVSSIFLKKPERITALMVIMVLSLMVYSFSEFYIRQFLDEAKQTIPNSLKKPTKKPTLKWIFFRFAGITVLTIRTKKGVSQTICNLTAVTKQVIQGFGPKAMAIYGLPCPRPG
jgi:transposase